MRSLSKIQSLTPLLLSCLAVMMSLPLLLPFVLEPQPTKTLEIYLNYLVGRQKRISELLGPFDIACAIGPYDGFQDEKFHGILNGRQMRAAEDLLEKTNESSLGSNGFYMVAFQGDRAMFSYISNFFHKSTILNSHSSSSLNCVDKGGSVELISNSGGKYLSLQMKNHESNK